MSFWTGLVVAGQMLNLAAVGVVAYFTWGPVYRTWKAIRDAGLPQTPRGYVDTSWLPDPPEIMGIAVASLWAFILLALGFAAQVIGTFLGAKP